MFTIKHKNKEYTFFWNGCYVFLREVVGGLNHIRDRQLCYGGGWYGNTVTAKNVDEFEKESRKWLKQYIKIEKMYTV